MIQLLLIMTFLPAFFWFFVFLKKDRFDPEPKRLLIKLFIFGIFAGIIAGIIEFSILLLFPHNYIHFFANLLLNKKTNIGINFYIFSISLIILFATLEEILKIIVVRFFAYNHPHFNQIVDGAIFGISSALGFATIENLNYFASTYLTKGLEALIVIFLLRFFASSLLHSISTGTSGYYLGKAKFTGKSSIFWQGLIAASLMHSTFNLFLLGGIWGVVIEILFLLLVLNFLLRRMGSGEAQLIRNLVLRP